MTEWMAARPGAAAYAGPPPAPFQSPYLVVGRIPEIEPYVVNMNKAKAGAICGSLVAFTMLLWIGLILFAFAASEGLNPLWIMLLPALISIGVNCFVWYTFVSGGPQLAMNPYGM